MGECFLGGLGGGQREWTKIDEYSMGGTGSSYFFAYGNLSNFDTDKYDRYKAVMTGTIKGGSGQVIYYGTLGASTYASFTQDQQIVNVNLSTEQLIVGGILIPADCTNASKAARGSWNYAQCSLQDAGYNTIYAVNIKIAVYARLGGT